jgi:acylphosphatase
VDGSNGNRRLHAIVKGRVQGVSFRFHTQEEAGRLGLVGWVKNVADGSVELEAEGPAADLETLVAWLHQGPATAQVSGVEIRWERARGGDDGFRISH